MKCDDQTNGLSMGYKCCTSPWLYGSNSIRGICCLIGINTMRAPDSIFNIVCLTLNQAKSTHTHAGSWKSSLIMSDKSNIYKRIRLSTFGFYICRKRSRTRSSHIVLNPTRSSRIFYILLTSKTSCGSKTLRQNGNTVKQSSSSSYKFILFLF